MDDYGLVGLPLPWQRALYASGIIQSSSSIQPIHHNSNINDIQPNTLINQQYHSDLKNMNNHSPYSVDPQHQLLHQPPPMSMIDDQVSNITSPISTIDDITCKLVYIYIYLNFYIYSFH